MCLQLKQISLWPPKKSFKEICHRHLKTYPNTRVIINATEVYIDQPKLPELQQMTFSSYKNINTYKALIGILPDGAIVFVLSLYSGSVLED